MGLACPGKYGSVDVELCTNSDSYQDPVGTPGVVVRATPAKFGAWLVAVGRLGCCGYKRLLGGVGALDGTCCPVNDLTTLRAVWGRTGILNGLPRLWNPQWTS